MTLPSSDYPDVVLSCAPVDLNVVVDQLDIPAKERFDLVIATNVFVYYDTLEQALGLRNISTLLKSGGFLLGDRLTDNHLPEDDYRFHDVFHLAFAAVLGWSPTTRA